MGISGWPAATERMAYMSLFEYSKWDGSQDFLTQSADQVFDQLAEYLLHHGDDILRKMDDLEDEIPEIVE